MPAIPGMKGEGYYDRHSAAQAASIRLVHDWIEEAAAALTLPMEPRPIALADPHLSRTDNLSSAAPVSRFSDCSDCRPAPLGGF